MSVGELSQPQLTSLQHSMGDDLATIGLWLETCPRERILSGRFKSRSPKSIFATKPLVFGAVFPSSPKLANYIFVLVPTGGHF